MARYKLIIEADGNREYSDISGFGPYSEMVYHAYIISNMTGEVTREWWVVPAKGYTRQHVLYSR